MSGVKELGQRETVVAIRLYLPEALAILRSCVRSEFVSFLILELRDG